MKSLVNLVFLSLLCCSMMSCISENSKGAASHFGEKKSSGILNHVVLLWLKENGNLDHRKKIIHATKKFNEIPSVIEVRVGEVVESNRTIVDDSFDLGILVIVKNKDALKHYLNHPIHQQTKQEILLPLVDKIKVYDF